MTESWGEYLDRVSRARHLLLDGMQEFLFYVGAASGYKNSSEYLTSGNNLQQRSFILGMSNHCKGMSIKALTKALIAQDRVLTYREDEL